LSRSASSTGWASGECGCRMTSASPVDNVPVSTLASLRLITVNSRLKIGRVGVDPLLTSGPGAWGDVEPVREMPVELVVRKLTGVAAI
jgi:hypothetical protein